MIRRSYIRYLALVLVFSAAMGLADEYADLIRTQESGGN